MDSAAEKEEGAVRQFISMIKQKRRARTEIIVRDKVDSADYEKKFQPTDRSLRGILIYDNGNYDGIELEDPIWEWEIELNRTMPKAYLVTEHGSLYILTESPGQTLPEIRDSSPSDPAPVDLLRLVKYCTSRSQTFTRLFGLSFDELFADLFS